MLHIAVVFGAVAVSVAGADDEMHPLEHELKHLELLNYRRKEGFTCSGGPSYEPNDVPLVWNCALWRAARRHSLDMATTNFFDHQSPNTGSPGDRARAEGVGFNSENIAAGNSMPEDTMMQWERSRGHCRGMMDPARRSMAVGFAMDVDADYWFYWTQMSSNDLPNPDDQDCVNGDSGSIPQPLPSAPPTDFPTISGPVNYDLLEFNIYDYEMQVLDLINQARKDGNEEECYGEFFTDLPPLDWNCALFRAARVHMADCVANDKWSRTGSNGLTLADRIEAEGVPDNCSSFMVSGYHTPEQFVQRLIQMACWAVFGEEYKSFGIAHHRNYGTLENMPWSTWLPIFNKYPASYTPELQTCGGGAQPAPVEQPTPAPSAEPTPAPSAEPTPAPSDAPAAAPSNAPSAAPTDAPTGAEGPLGCTDISEKKACKKDSACCWKKDKCNEKSKLCPKQRSEKKCTKLDCVWDSESESCAVGLSL